MPFDSLVQTPCALGASWIFPCIVLLLQRCKGSPKDPRLQLQFEGQSMTSETGICSFTDKNGLLCLDEQCIRLGEVGSKRRFQGTLVSCWLAWLHLYRVQALRPATQTGSCPSFPGTDCCRA
ncbi:hypothetical protein K437DRAFT_253686 [Tilletiaria anomala UBC 951]|uniref:Uncharacterized protein n=1 Tax=Tilletiaria anomala (strain ATCC 24038 / CBS 436.72 / UBC 951) TaxID=1037660 RepID=A0A066WGC8_TILAU|nr:uncharacterized protein K437DRAFT_253686 [Tilletiaria anomala UBC 951]KDN53032.1 hypothetical protein K437DRAFT_253686 [Tilletiaria anomala UBC 951]